MNKTITFQYHCRRCGATINTHPTTDEGTQNGINNPAAAGVLSAAISGTSWHDVGLYAVHDCEDGGRGIADLVGHDVAADGKD